MALTMILILASSFACLSEQHKDPENITIDRRYCNTPSDCHDNECCVSLNQPIGRRSVPPESHKGYCVPLGTEGSGCIVKFGNATSRPDNVVLSCPCGPRFYCKGNGVFVVPLGEQGTCTKDVK